MGKLFGVLLAAATALAFAAGSATAGRGIQLSVGSGELGRVGLSGTWTFKTLEGAVIRRCTVTATVSLNSSIAKVSGTATGRTTAASFSGELCELSFPVLAEDLPWNVTYQGFLGALPAISGLELQLATRFLYAEEFNHCQLAGTLAGRTSGSPISTLTISEGVVLLQRIAFPCPASVKVDASLRFEPAVSMTLLR